MVDPDDALIAEVVASAAPDILQLHGRETPERVAEVRARWGIPVMKAVPVETADDARAARRFSPAADLILFDARAPADSTRPGGNGAPFDWRLLLGVEERWRSCSRAASPRTTSPRPSASPAPRSSMSPRASRAAPAKRTPTSSGRFLRAAKGV